LSNKAKRVPSSNGELPFSTDSPLLSVGELLNKEGKPLNLEAAKKIKSPWKVLGQCLKTYPVDVVMGFHVVPHDREEKALERDDVLVRLLEQKARCVKTNVQDFAGLAAILPKARKATLRAMLERREESRRWPAGVGRLQGSRGPLLFLFDHVVGVPQQTRRGPLIAVEEPRTNGDFARAFKEAFDRLRRDRPFNMVELAALRQALRSYSREQFDQGLHALRKSREFVLETFEGRHGSLSPEELAAAVREDGRIFAFAARRDNG
jgi:hypothetical protein